MGKPGQVITTAAIASLVNDAWHNSFTPLNILSGFKKCGIHPLNPGEVSDRQLCPSKAVTCSSQPECFPKPKSSVVDDTSQVQKSAKSIHGSTSTECSSNSSNKLFTLDQIKLFQHRFEEGYNLKNDTEYTTWLKIYHPEIGSSPGSSSEHELSKSESSSSVNAIKGLLVLPKPNPKSQKRKGKNALNSKGICITDPKVLEDLKKKEAEKDELAEQKRERMIERAKKKEQKEREKERSRREKQASKTAREKDLMQDMNVIQKFVNLNLSGYEEDDAQCPLCGLFYKDDESGDSWVCCDKCNEWYCFKCSGTDDLSAEFYCELCYQ